ncbi:MAG: helix-turn-helix transcriptional regulator [Clostridia bacterium]|nr:helix-turn-helix transcriptional regulator [Clostridia bacterium]
MDYGKKLKEYRKERNMTQEHLAEKLGVSTTTLYNWENGVSKPREENRKALNELLHLDETEVSEEIAIAEDSASEKKDGKADGKEELLLEISVVSREDLYYNAPICTEEVSLQNEASREELVKKRRLQLALQMIGLVVLLCLELCVTVFVAMNFCIMLFRIDMGHVSNSTIKFPFSWWMFWVGFLMWIVCFAGMLAIVRKMIRNIKNMVKERKRRKQGELV